MSRPRADYAAMHEAADHLEARLSRSFARAVAQVRAGVSINDLAMALSAKDARRAQALITKAAVRDALAPSASIVRDAVVKGGKLGAAAVNRAMRNR